jgi:hypothetical protein
MKTYIAQWPDGTISIVSAEGQTDLFWKLDAEADPNEAKLFVIQDDEELHITTRIVKDKKGEPKIEFDSNDGEIKRYRFKKGITEKAFQYLCPEATSERIKEVSTNMGITYK